MLEGHRRELRQLKGDQQMAVARAKESVRDTKDKEISDLRNKYEQVCTCLVVELHLLSQHVLIIMVEWAGYSDLLAMW